MSKPTNEPIEDYLDDLLLHLHQPPRDTRRVLAEAEDHLRATADSLRQQGLSAVEAEREAIRRYGDVNTVVGSHRVARRAPTLGVVTAVGQAGALLAGLALVAIGLSGAIAAAMNAVAGPRFVGDLPGSYSGGLCHYFLGAHPTADSCRAAAMLENSSDAVSLRVLAGAAGVVVLVAWWLWRRGSGPRSRFALVDVAVACLAAVASGAAAAVLVGWAVDIAVQHGSGGVGWYLSGGIAALVAFAPSAAIAYRSVKPAIARGMLAG